DLIRIKGVVDGGVRPVAAYRAPRASRGDGSNITELILLVDTRAVSSSQQHGNVRRAGRVTNHRLSREGHVGRHGHLSDLWRWVVLCPQLGDERVPGLLERGRPETRDTGLLSRGLWVDQLNATAAEVLRPGGRLRSSGYSQLEDLLKGRIGGVPGVNISDRGIDRVVACDRPTWCGLQLVPSNRPRRGTGYD